MSKECSALTLEEITGKASALVPELMKRRGLCESLRRLPDETIGELRDIGVFEMAIPRYLGGPDLGPDGILELSIQLARGCGATAWCAGNWAIHNLLIALFSEQARIDIYNDGETPIVSTGFSPLRAKTLRVEGGFELTGQWDFVSGVDHADWLVLVATGESGLLAHVVPRSDVTIVDTWYTTGLRGTGSQDVKTDRIFVPQHRTMDMVTIQSGNIDDSNTTPSPFLRLPLSNYFGCGVIGTVLGSAIGALEIFSERTSNNLGGLSGLKAGSRPEVQLRLGESAADIDAALLMARTTYREMRLVAESAVETGPVGWSRWRRDLGWSAKIATSAVLRLYEAGGAHVIFDSDELQRFYRDINTGSHHFAIAWDALFSSYGRVHLGLEA